MISRFPLHRLILICSLLLTACQTRKDHNHLPGNFFKIDEYLYRSEQPTAAEMKALDRMGIRTIINMRFWKTDKRRVKNTTIHRIHLPVNTWHLSSGDLEKVLTAIRDANKPVLLHCKHGSDRTGAVIAAYRMVYHDWPREKAIEEMKREEFGFHEVWFPNIPSLLDTLDVERLKTRLKVNS